MVTKMTQQQRKIIELMVKGVGVKSNYAKTFNRAVNGISASGNYQKNIGSAYQY